MQPQEPTVEDQKAAVELALKHRQEQINQELNSRLKDFSVVRSFVTQAPSTQQQLNERMLLLKLKAIRFFTSSNPAGTFLNLNEATTIGSEYLEIARNRRQNFLSTYSLHSRYVMLQCMCIFFPFWVRRRSFRTLFWTFIAGGQFVCPEVNRALFTRNDEQMKEFAEKVAK